MAAGEDVEVAGLQLEDDGAGDADFFCAEAVQTFSARRRIMGSVSVRGMSLREGVFGGDGFGGAVGDDWAVVDAASEFVETQAVTAEAGFECREVLAAEIAYGL